jgi:Glycosyl transferase family 2
MKWIRCKKKDQVDPGSKAEALLPGADVVSSGLSRIEQQIEQVILQNKNVLDLNNKVLEQNTSMIRTISNAHLKDAEAQDLDIEQGSFTVKAGDTEWKVSGYSSIAPDADFDYFPALNFKPTRIDGVSYNFYPHKVISCIIPCYNESAKELKRSIRSLFRQRMPPGWRVEAVIVMDGADCMEDSLVAFLSTMFGVRFNTNDPEDPFLKLSHAETIIVEPINEDAAQSRTPVIENTVGGFSLVVKRTNQRKANSQMWWLGPHSSGIGCKYSLATDCGTVFSRTATVRLIRRMEAEPDLHAVTGFQRIMTSEMQGDGSWEFFHDPASHCLRMLQRFEFEVSTKDIA